MSARNKRAAKDRRRNERAYRKAAFQGRRDEAAFTLINDLYRAFWGI